MIRKTMTALLVLAAAASPALANDCSTPEVIGVEIDAINSMLPPAMKNEGTSVIDASNITTVEISPAAHRITCHFTAIFSDGNKVPGTWVAYNNVAGRFTTTWTPDASRWRR